MIILGGTGKAATLLTSVAVTQGGRDALLSLSAFPDALAPRVNSAGHRVPAAGSLCLSRVFLFVACRHARLSRL